MLACTDQRARVPENGKAGTWKAIWKASIAGSPKTETITFDVFEK